MRCDFEKDIQSDERRQCEPFVLIFGIPRIKFVGVGMRGITKKAISGKKAVCVFALVFDSSV